MSQKFWIDTFYTNHRIADQSNVTVGRIVYGQNFVRLLLILSKTQIFIG